jgi:hypothetical protein
MPFSHQFKPAHKEIKRYHEELAGHATHEVAHEGATSSAFQNLLAATCKKADWHLVPQLSTRIRGKQVRPDGTLRDEFNLHHGYWEAKDSSDKLDEEIRKKIALGYPLSNTIFEDTSTAVLYQNGKQVEPRFDARTNRNPERFVAYKPSRLPAKSTDLRIRGRKLPNEDHAGTCNAELPADCHASTIE